MTILFRFKIYNHYQKHREWKKNKNLIILIRFYESIKYALKFKEMLKKDLKLQKSEKCKLKTMFLKSVIL